MYDELINIIDTCGLAKKQILICWTRFLKMNKIKGEIPDITDLATTNALNSIKSEIPMLVI